MTTLTTYQRALQIYQVLTCAAHNRQTITYERLGSLIGLPAVGLGMHLKHLLEYGEAHDLPPLTVLVVQKHDGTPSTGFRADADINEVREQVYEFEWFKQPPLTEEDFLDFAK